MQTSPISFVARGKGTFSACNKGNRRRLHAGKIRAELGIINLRAGKMKQILCFDWLPSGKMDTSRQLEDFPRWAHKKRSSFNMAI